MTSPEVQTYAQALYETLMASALEQLRSAAPRLARLDAKATDVQQQIDSILPKQTLPEVRNFLHVLAKEGALGEIKAIVGAFQESYAQGGPRILHAEVTSAIELTDKQRERIATQLREQYQAQIELSFQVDDSLIGGLVIRVGDQVLDNSLRSRLGNIQRNMLRS